MEQKLRILFILKKGNDDPYILTFTSHFLEYLSSSHQLGLVTDISYSQQLIKYKKENINYSEWDLVILQDLSSFLWFEENSQSHAVPVVFISHYDNWRYYPPDSGNLLQVFCAHAGKNIPVSRELISATNKAIFTSLLPVQEVMVKNDGVTDKKIRLVYFYQDTDPHLTIAKTIISVINTRPDMELTIYGDSLSNSLLKPLINSNITLVQTGKADKQALLGYDLALTSDYYALQTLSLGIPTMIVGERGYGGIVTSEKLVNHLKWHFCGRIGAEIGELIPFWMLYDELDIFKKDQLFYNKDSNVVSTEINNIYQPLTIFKLLEDKMMAAYSQYDYVYSANYHSMIPKLAKEIRIEPAQQANTFLLIRENNKIVGLISATEMSIFRQLKDGRSILQIAEEEQIATEEIGDFFRSLWQTNIVTF